ncbi:malto-oligosyltrehalose synthase [Burkholderia sp. WAC0059]|uniref:malto-oligosyltrehalose synthase n=1 Tax=Burkholderia sp. WAC0059 TaxID=2066022 RepID=UPI000C7EE325|nr:malto-oligosyltrehalose synthase [Burkholderia sp. WAC0059]PLZ00599.1 malto-oligosyltrehalose synthase [Burkholderia sp. WAC0059]
MIPSPGRLPPTTPRATARLQLHAGFTLDDATRRVPYYAALGVSHLYLSPIFTACPGSQHGYDVTDFNRVNPALGGEAALRRLVDRLRPEGMGLILDIVPNHMAASCRYNVWWRDVLQYGEQSRHANFFDIDWQVPDPALYGKLLLPILGLPYGEALAAGDLALDTSDPQAGFQIRYFDTLLPLAPATCAEILRADPHARFEHLAARWSAPVDGERGRNRLADWQSALLREQAGTALDDLLLAHDAHTPAGRTRLHQLLEKQHYRLAWWRTAADEINWRRFFEINELVGLRAEQPEVFEATHALVFRLYREGLIDGVRVDHVDGLTDPAAYCLNLRRRLSALTPQRPAGLNLNSAYLVVEKVLAQNETLRSDWEVDGTTGYEFMNDVSAVLHADQGASGLSATWHNVAGDTADFAAYERAARRQILTGNLCSERDTVVRYLHRLARLQWHTRDLSQTMIQRALEAILLNFPVYRTYFPGHATTADAAILQAAVSAAREILGAADHPVLDQLHAWLGNTRLADPNAEAWRLRALTRFQQLSSPLAAKAVEDTAFYRYGRLLSRNEVGSKPDDFALQPQAFHHRIAMRARLFPHAMLTTATHDHKRGPDARARLAVLSEIAPAWDRAVQAWRAQASRLGPGPDAIDQLMLYQTLIGSWPLDLPVPPETVCLPALHAFMRRVETWQLKSLREAKRRSNWIAPDLAYEKTCAEFLARLERDFTDDDGLLASIGRFAGTIAAAGALNGLTQTALHLSAPGVPDLYQGSESWDFSLVDPDNRQAVAYERLEHSLQHPPTWPEALLNWRDGSIKQKLVHAMLQLRKHYPALFTDGTYSPLHSEGLRQSHLIGLTRQHEGVTLLAVASRLSLSHDEQAMARDSRPLPLIPPAVWQDSAMRLPLDVAQEGTSGHWLDVLNAQTVEAHSGRLYARDVLETLPVAILLKV